jgi:hypothetical protein
LKGAISTIETRRSQLDSLVAALLDRESLEKAELAGLLGVSVNDEQLPLTAT